MGFLEGSRFESLQRLSFSRRFPVEMGLLTGMMIGVLHFAGVLEGYERKAYDWRFRMRPDQDAGEEVVVLFANDVTLRKMAAVAGRWPWPREVWAAIQKKLLSDAGATSVAYDVLFDLPEREEASDRAFESAVRSTGNVFLACLFREARQRAIPVVERREFRGDWDPPPEAMRKFSLPLSEEVSQELKESLPDHLDVTLPIGPFLEAARGCGGVSYHADADGVIRRFPLIHHYAGEFYPSLPLLVACDRMGVSLEQVRVDPGGRIELPLSSGTVRIPVDREMQMLVNFRSADLGALPSLNFLEAWKDYGVFLDGGEKGSLSVLEGKAVVIGSIAEATEDIRGAPVTSSLPMTYAVATTIDTILKQDFLRESRWWMDLGLILLNSVFVGLWSSWFRPLMRVLLTLLQGGCLLVVNFLFFYPFRVCLPVLAPGLAIVVPFTAVLLVKYGFERNARRNAERTFGHYLDPKIVAQMVRRPEMLGLGGVTREVTILFSDLCGFTPISEKMTSQEVVRMLNGYFEEMVAAVAAHGGMVDKYVGDAIMAVFGIPERREDDPIRAVHCGLEMLRRLEGRKSSPSPGFFSLLNVRIGINSGSVTAGNIGTQLKRQYTIIGDAVNTAERLEELAPTNSILISEPVYERVREELAVTPMGRVQPTGKSASLAVYRVDGLRGKRSETGKDSWEASALGTTTESSQPSR